MKKKKLSRFGFTLLEVLVAMTVSLGLGLTIVQVFISSSRTVAEATQKLDMISQTRIPLERANYLLSSAIEVPGRDQKAILYPLRGSSPQNRAGVTVEDDKPDTWYNYVVFRTTEDFLNYNDPNPERRFDPDQIMDPNHFTNNFQQYRQQAHRVFDYVMWYEDDSLANNDHLPGVDKALCLARIQHQLDGNGNTIFRDATWAAGDPWADMDTSPVVIPGSGATPYRILSHGCDEITFLPRSSGAIQMSVVARGDVQTNGGTITKEFRASSFIQIPSTVGQ